ncbi:MAG: helix-turn-helix domain-containing protein [Candidatus Heimdallarchaeaceae archaeon]
MNQPRNSVIIRKRVVKKVLDGENVTSVAKRFRISRKFVYKWLKRYRENPYGEWWKERSRRPKNIQKKVTEEVRASKDHRVEERIRIKRDEDRTMVQEERTEDLSYNDMEGPKTRRREELEEKDQESKSEEEVRKKETQ